MKIALASDLKLGFKFSHMSAVKHTAHERRLREEFSTLISHVQNESFDIFVILGNLFASYTPKNEDLSKVVEQLHFLSEKQIHTLILPGPLDSPLQFADDCFPHQVFLGNSYVHLLIPNTNEDRLGVIDRPIIEIPGEWSKTKKTLQIYAQKPMMGDLNKLQIKSLPDPTKYSVMCLYGEINPTENSKTIVNPYQISLKLLQNLIIAKFDAIWIGGPNDTNVQKLVIQKFGDRVHLIPPMFPSRFDFQHTCGLTILTPKERLLIPFEGFRCFQENMEVTGKPVATINNSAKLSVKKNSNARHTYFQMHLTGSMSRLQYHELELFEMIEKGEKANFYFEMADNIDFSDKVAPIGGLRFLDEINAQLTLERNKLEQDPASTLSPDQLAKEIALLSKVKARIDQDWKEMEE